MTTFLTRWTLAAFALLLAGIVDPQPATRATASVAIAVQAPEADRPPERPRATVDIPALAVTGKTIRVPAGGDLQAALDEARPGDLIALEPRATYKGPFRLRHKSGNGWIVIASAARDLPPSGRRVDPSHAPLMPRLIASSGSVVYTEAGAHHYRFIGVEIAPAEGEFLNTLVQLGDDDAALETLPHDIVFDRVYIHGDPKRGARRGVAMNSRRTAVVDSYLADFKEVGADTQAIAGWNGAGPFKIANNYLEAAGENVMFGGADPTIPNLVPADIEVVRNHLAKPLRWKAGHETFEGVEWAVKNLLELKNARRVLIDGNLFEYNWPHAQNGFAILFTVRNQEGEAPWSTIEDVIFTNNLVRHVAAGINILGRDDNHPSLQARRIAIRNNVFLDVGGRWGNGRLFQLLNGTSGVSIDHNTAFQTGSILSGGDSVPHTSFVFQNNVVPHNEHGITGSGTGPGTATLERYFPRAVVRRNVIVGGPAGRYPGDNFFPAALDEAASGPAALDSQTFRTLVRPFGGRATDGRDPGADITVAEKALGGVATVSQLPTSSSQLPIRALALGGWGFGALGVGAWKLEVGTWELIFWASLLLIGYVYAGYPVIAVLRAILRPKTRRTAPIEPSVSVVVVAHNEAHRIAARIENLLALDYPYDRLEIVVASDGSTDGTAACARAYAAAGVVVYAFDERRGKSAVINAVVPRVRGEIVVFADARQRFDSDSVRALVANFADADVGAVSGELVLTTDDRTTTAARGTAFYWRYEKFIRSAEGRSNSALGATGAIYAIRRSLFEPIPDDTILDDVLIPLRITRRGYRVLFEPRARAFDSASATAQQEFIRKARTSAGTCQLFAREGWLLNPFRNRLWFETISHKALRVMLPVLHAAALLANVALADRWFYGWMLAGQVAFYAAALVGCAQRQARRRSIVFSIPCAICLHSWVTVVGFVRFATNRQQVTWERVPAPVSGGSAGSVPSLTASVVRSEMTTRQPEARSAA
ncbi:MAG TPA: glycosyltransferase family 2 protein [Vicinamibacterales bacterium]